MDPEVKVVVGAIAEALPDLGLDLRDVTSSLAETSAATTTDKRTDATAETTVVNPTQFLFAV